MSSPNTASGPLPPVHYNLNKDNLGELKAGTLSVKLAQTVDEIEEAQRLRYHVFVQTRGAKSTPLMQELKRDFDNFDEYCDHLLVLEHNAPSGKPDVVGTYRLLRRSAMQKLGYFYTASEFDISAVVAHPGEILELGRSCVHENYRNRAVMQLLWRGIGAYVALYKIELMFGCASFPGIDVNEHAAALSYLHHYHLAPPELRLTSLPKHYVNMNLMPKETINVKRAFAALPPLIKGYLRLSGYIGDGAMVDKDYNTVDVGIVVKTTLVTEKYFQRYGQSSADEA